MTLREQITSIKLLQRTLNALRAAKRIPNVDPIALLAQFDELREEIGRFLEPAQCACTDNGVEHIRCGGVPEPGQTLCRRCIGGHQRSGASS